jgi:hypothetical protein
MLVLGERSLVSGRRGRTSPGCQHCLGTPEIKISSVVLWTESQELLLVGLRALPPKLGFSFEIGKKPRV